ncbi:zinc ABC transporter substrate-binding protein [candidate division WOR-3 bacterium]|nr:zinc ABC transporter substrate-binding protein [candidate division WOR-3 bacterium]
MSLTRRKIALIVSEVVLVLFLTGCRVKTVEEKGEISLCTSIYPLYQIAQSVLGDSGEAFNIVPPGANPHVFEPAPSDARKLSEANIILCVSPEFDGWMEKFAGSETKVLYLDKYFSENNIEPGDNPHVWLSLKYALLIASAVRDAAVETRPERRDYYWGNFSFFEKEINSLDSFASVKIGELRGAYFVQWHPAWNYLANDYGLPEPLSIETGHGDEPTPGDLKNIADFITEKNVKVIVIEASSDLRQAQNIALQTGVEILILDPLGNPSDSERSSYISNMKKNISDLSEALDDD